MSSPGKPMSIGIVTPTLSRSGGGIFPIVRAHALGLHRQPDLAVTVRGLHDRHADEDAPSLAPVKVVTYTPSLEGFGLAPRLARDLLDSGHDVVHQHALWLYPSIAVSRWRRATRKPVVISTQGMLEPWALANSRMKKRIAAALFESSNLAGAACIHCSEAEVEGVRAFGLRNPVAVLANGVDLPTLASVPARASGPDTRRVLLFLGRIHPKKGIVELLHAWSMVKQRAPGIAKAWRLVIAGWDDGGHASQVEALASELGLADDVALPGPVFGEEKKAVLASAGAFILPSYSEGLPMSVLEAWSYGLAVFMTRECNLPSGFDAGAAVQVTTNPEAMAGVLAQSLGAGELSRIGEKGRALVESSFTWNSIVADLASVYRWLGGRGPRPSFVRMT